MVGEVQCGQRGGYVPSMVPTFWPEDVEVPTLASLSVLFLLLPMWSFSLILSMMYIGVQELITLEWSFRFRMRSTRCCVVLLEWGVIRRGVRAMYGEDVIQRSYRTVA